MSLKLHDLPCECKLATVMQTQLLQDIYPLNLVEAALKERSLAPGEPKKLRQRKLSLLLIVWMVITMNWYPKQSQLSVLTTLSRGARFLWPSDEIPLPGASALVYRRKPLGTEPVQALFRSVCKPLATPQTQGAFRLGYRIMAIDGTWQNVPDTAANATAFGRFQSGKSQSAFPQARRTDPGGVRHACHCGRR
jgi:hypothetical protein